MRFPARVLLIALAAVVATLAGVVGPVTHAQAHALVEKITPADGQRLDAAPARVTIRFSEAVQLLRRRASATAASRRYG